MVTFYKIFSWRLHQSLLSHQCMYILESLGHRFLNVNVRVQSPHTPPPKGKWKNSNTSTTLNSISFRRRCRITSMSVWCCSDFTPSSLRCRIVCASVSQRLLSKLEILRFPYGCQRFWSAGLSLVFYIIWTPLIPAHTLTLLHNKSIQGLDSSSSNTGLHGSTNGKEAWPIVWYGKGHRLCNLSTH